MKHCEFYVGDSYHALCFSLLFHKPFIIIYGKADYSFSGARFMSLLRIVGLEDRLVETLDDFEACKKIVQKPIDWEQVNARLDAMREPSFRWLECALKEKAKAPTAEEYYRDAQMRKFSEYGMVISEQSREIEDLRNKLANMDRRIAILSESKLHWLKRKTRGGIQCLKDNGLAYTIKRVGQKVKNKLR